MKKSIIAISFLVLMILFASPVSASAETKAGIRPSSFFYFFDTTFEKINLFFTFSSEKKAQKNLEYANERLAEAEAVAQEKNTDAVKTAVAGYESNIASAAEESSQIKDKGKTEELLNSIADNTSKHQEILAEVLNKVPDEAKDAIIKAIEVSRKGQEEALKQVAELKGEVEQLKKEVAELKEKDENQTKTIEEMSNQKPETKPKSTPTPTVTKPTTSQTSEVKPTPTPAITSSQTSTTTTTTLPNGAVVEMDKNGNIIRTIKEAPKQTEATLPISTPTTPVSTIPTEPLKILSVIVSSTWETMVFEWETSKPSNSKVFISGGGTSSKVYSSESGLSTRHIAHISGLSGNTNYTYEIESIIDGEVVKKQGSYTTKQVNENASLKITSSCTKIFPGTYCDVEVSYFEGGQQKNISAVKVSSNDNGLFIESSYPGVTCIGELSANSDGSQRKGNPLTCGTRPSPRDGKPIALFTYLPSASGTRILTATANGATATAESQGQISECEGVVRGEGVCQL